MHVSLHGTVFVLSPHDDLDAFCKLGNEVVELSSVQNRWFARARLERVKRVMESRFSFRMDGASLRGVAA